MNEVKRPLRDDERALLDFLLSIDFPGRAELKAQAEHATVSSECECGCGTFSLELPPNTSPAVAHEPIPVEAAGKGLDVLLFVLGGFLDSVEIVHYGDAASEPLPQTNTLELWIRQGPAISRVP